MSFENTSEYEMFTSTALPTAEASTFNELTLGLVLPLVFFGTLLCIVTVCVFWHSRAGNNFSDSTRNSEGSSFRRSFVDTFGRFGPKANTARQSLRSEAPLHEQAIPNDYIPPLYATTPCNDQTTKIRTTVKRIRPQQPQVANNPIQVDTKSTLTESQQFTPDLSTVTEEDSVYVAERNLGFMHSDPYLGENRLPVNSRTVPLRPFHMAPWLHTKTDRSIRVLDNREVRSDPNIVFRPNSLSESSELSTLPTVPSKSDYSLTSSEFTSGSRSLPMHKSPFHPNNNSPITTNSYELDGMRHSIITREGAPDQMAEYRSDFSNAASSSASQPLSGVSSADTRPDLELVTTDESNHGIVHYLVPEFHQFARRQSSHGSSTYKIETSNDTMILYESGTRAPPGSRIESFNSNSFISSQETSVSYQQAELQKIVSSYNELNLRYRQHPQFARHSSAEVTSHGLVLKSDDTSMNPQVGSSNTTVVQPPSRRDWDRQSSVSSGGDTQMLAGGPLPLRPPAPGRQRKPQEHSSTSDSDHSSIARKRPRATAGGADLGASAASSAAETVPKKRSFSSGTWLTPPSMGSPSEWDPYHPSPTSTTFGHPLLNSTNLSSHRQQTQTQTQTPAHPVLANKQWWV